MFHNSIVPNFSDDSISQVILKFTAVYGHNPLKEPTVTGNKLKTGYSITTYQDGRLCEVQNGGEKRAYFFPDELYKGQARLLNFIYRKKIPDHKISMSIFDIEIISQIIKL